CLAECLGNSLLADTLRDFTARTTLIAMLYQSSHDAAQSCGDHVAIVQALEHGDLVLAEQLMQAHIGSVQATLKLQTATGDPLAELRSALSPMSNTSSKAAPDLHTSMATKPMPKSKTKRVRLPSPAASADPTTTNPPPDSSTYLGALL
ncbi:MAG: FCD domain-containing protein, partial [Polaromonas sp.]